MIFFGIFVLSSLTTLFGGFVILYFILFLILLIIISEIFVRLDYKNWKYEFTSDSLKIERGVIVKRYKSIPYDRIQNIDITRGVFARMLGFSTIDIQTAGYSVAYGNSSSASGSEGHLPAVSVEGAEKIREFLMKKIYSKKGGM